ncbi:hypothetical protein Tco_0331748 [Tanacetum coccineum]
MLNHDVKSLDLDPSNNVLRDEEVVYIQAFNDSKIDEERFLKQKAKIEWLEVGDSNSAYFYKSIKSRHQRSKINVITTVDNVEVTDNSVPNVFVSHYEAFIGTKMACELLDSEGLFCNKVSDVSIAKMTKPITNDEIKKAMFDIGNDKAPGPDGKILTNRIIDGIKEVVSENQSAFVLGRRILDNILITQELMHNYHLDRGPPRCAFKVDIPKAYDTMDCQFLGHILKCFGFHRVMIKWVMACVTSTSFSISINGDIHGFFKGKRGLRQGDPLSPYLFTLVMEILMPILKKKVRLSDSFRGDVASAKVIVESLNEFKEVSGLVPSIPKSTTEGYSLRTCVAELLMHGVWNWPPTWLVKAPILGSIATPALGSSRQDNMKWRDSNDNICEFSVKLAWEELRSRRNKVLWFHTVWFSHCIPRHAFHLWLVMIRSLKMHDKPKPWDVGPATDLSQLSCSLCEMQADSHEHLFFECTYSSQVWNYVRMYAGMENVNPHLDDILLWCQSLSTKRTFKGVVGKLIFAAASYFIWMERNARLFKNVKRPPEDIRDLILVTVRLKLHTFNFKNMMKIRRLLSLRKMPNSLRLYD